MDRISASDGAVGGDAGIVDAGGADAFGPCGVEVPDDPATPLAVSAGLTCVQLGGATDDRVSECGGAGGRDLFFELNVTESQMIYVDTFGSDVPLAVTMWSSACRDLPGGLPTCTVGPCSEGTQALLSSLTGPVCIVVDEVVAGTGPAQVVLRVEPTGAVGAAVTPTPSFTNTCSLRDDWLTTMGCGDTPAQEIGYFFTLCPGEVVDVTASVDSCGPAARDLSVSLRAGPAGTTQLGCSTGTCALAPAAALSYPGLSGPDMFWFVVDGPSTTCGDTMTSISLVPTN